MSMATRRETWDRLNQLRKKRRWKTSVNIALVLLGPTLAVVTYLGLGPFELDPSSNGIRLILLADLIYALVLAALVMQAVAKMVAARRRGSAGSQLHLRLTGVFAAVALIPTVLVAVFAVITVNFGLEGWFSERVRSVVGTSLQAAQAYEQEQRNDLTEDTQRLVGYVNIARQAATFFQDSDIHQLLSQAQQQVQRGLKEAFIIDGAGVLRARGERSYLFDFEAPGDPAMLRAAAGDLVIIEDWDNNEFRAIKQLSAFSDRYLYVSRTVDGNILSLLDTTRENVRLYNQLENDRGRLLFEFGLIYLGFAILLILAAVWLGMSFAERLARPVGRLASAAQKVGAGDLDVQVIESESNDEIALLGQLFNQMTRELKGQRDTLLSTTEQIERRRRLFDSVLSSVTAGVIGLDANGLVTFVNRSASTVLELDSEAAINGELADIVPEFGDLLSRLVRDKLNAGQEEIKVTRSGKLESLLVRMATRTSEDGALEGYVIAFDDVSELVSAQKLAAWGDVARRIAHEIKNPLTPIQLSAERLRRKFAPLAGDQSEALEQYTGVIIRQTEDLRRIVDEFSKFARMPEPERRRTDVSSLVRDAVLLQRSGQPNVEISLTGADEPAFSEVDQTMISQALTNLIKNAGEAIESAQEMDMKIAHKPRVKVDLSTSETRLLITIADNGIGLPEDRTRLFEPYVTTRDKGTGLGLPIVKKIIEEHGGTFSLRDAAPFDETGHRGAEAVIDLPRLLGQSELEQTKLNVA
jgi:two-component system nitrogen regulation sensor histidine kinase NtrY